MKLLIILALLFAGPTLAELTDAEMNALPALMAESSIHASDFLFSSYSAKRKHFALCAVLLLRSDEEKAASYFYNKLLINKAYYYDEANREYELASYRGLPTPKYFQDKANDCFRRYQLYGDLK